MFEALQELGLTENEIRLYTMLLKTGTTTPGQLAESTGFSRSYLYDALQRLQEKELVNTVFVKNKKHFQATDPAVLVETFRSRLERVERIIPELVKYREAGKKDIHVELHKGKYVYKTLLRDITVSLEPGKEVLIFGIDDEVLSRLDQHYLTNLNLYFSKLRRRRIHEKVIVKKGAPKLPEAKTSQYRFLPEASIGNTAFEVYANKVAVFLWGEPNYLILIENQEVADSYQKQFDILWKVAKG